MKIKLSPELSYLIGLWRKSKSFDGLGVRGKKELLEIFSKEAIDNKLITSDKILYDETQVFFYHTAYRKFFQEIEKNQLERFKYLNDYSASYLAGMFDAVGNIDEKGIISIDKMNRQDDMLFLRLGFKTKKVPGTRIMERPLVFLAFIRSYTRLYKSSKIFDYVESKSKKRKN